MFIIVADADTVVLKLVSDTPDIPTTVTSINDGSSTNTPDDLTTDKPPPKKRGRKKLAETTITVQPIGPNIAELTMVPLATTVPAVTEPTAPKGRPMKPNSPLKQPPNPPPAAMNGTTEAAEPGKKIIRRRNRKPSKWQSGKATQETIGLLANAIKNKPKPANPPVFPTASVVSDDRRRRSSAGSNTSQASSARSSSRRSGRLNSEVSPVPPVDTELSVDDINSGRSMISPPVSRSRGAVIQSHPGVDRMLWNHVNPPPENPATLSAQYFPSGQTPNRDTPLFKSRRMHGASEGAFSAPQAKGTAMSRSTMIQPYYDNLDVCGPGQQQRADGAAPLMAEVDDDDIQIIRMAHSTSAAQSSSEASVSG